MQERLHPQEQVRRYVEYLQDFNRYLAEHPGSLAGCAYLHNAASGNIAGLRHPDLADLNMFPAFAADELAALRSFFTTRLAAASGAQFADDFLASKIAPSKQLLRHVQQEITANPQFTLLDEQQVAYQVVMRAVEHAKRADAKEAVLITGGPGSGKSVIAVALLGELAKRGYNVSHATGSRSFTVTLRQVVGRRVRRVGELFRYTNNFMEAERNSLDVLIVDEAHRIRETSTNRFTRAAKRLGTPQADELVRAARVPVFLLDEHQVVRPQEIGTVASIEHAAARNGAVVRRWISTDSSAAAAPGSTSHGWRACSACAQGAQRSGVEMTPSSSSWLIPQVRWNENSSTRLIRAMCHGLRQGSAGLGASLVPTEHLWMTSLSARGAAPGISALIRP
jgi:uncharacterized protein